MNQQLGSQSYLGEEGFSAIPLIDYCIHRRHLSHPNIKIVPVVTWYRRKLSNQAQRDRPQEIRDWRGMAAHGVTMMRFEGKVAIVTASTQGIGFGIAERLGLEGASVVISSRKKENVDEAVDRLRGRGIEAFGVVCHVSNPDHRKHLIHSTIQKYGKIDVVVCNAAANPTVAKILEMPESALDKLWEVNVKSSILLLQDASPHLKKGSSIVFISSIAGYQPDPGVAMYGVTKTAILGLTKALATEMAPDTRVNTVAPGFVPTKFASYLTKDAAARKSIEDKTLLSRLGTTTDMAAATAFLASDDASYITGETLVVSGGMHSRL